MSSSPFSGTSAAALADAIGRDDAALIKLLVSSGGNPNAEGEGGITLLQWAAATRNRRAFVALLAAGARVNAPSGRGETAVHVAAFSGDEAMLRAALAGGGDVNARNVETGATPLVQALLSSCATLYRVLLDAGADPNLADSNSDAPLHVAARINAGAAILALLQRGASALARNSLGATFQTYYFGYPRTALNLRALAERRDVVAWLTANSVPLEANVESGY